MSCLKYAIVFPCSLFLSGCWWSTPTVPVNLDYVETSYGYINAGDFRAGSLFVWARSPNQKTERLDYLGNLNSFKRQEPVNVTISDHVDYSRGVDVNIDAKYNISQIDIDTAVSQRARFKLTNFERHKTPTYVTVFSDFIKYKYDDKGNKLGERSQGEIDIVMQALDFREIARNPNIYYLLVTDVTYGDKMELEIDENIVTGNSFKVPVFAGDLKVDLVGKSLRKLEGKYAELLFRVDVLQPVWINNKQGGQNPGFKVVTRDFSLVQMPELLRKIGTEINVQTGM
ncbi:hypothetical protein J7481_02465 [Labrenzia sp. R4_2]|uniref:hypothetical protein n=1 Tax=Labrenzia sp. R4_2 TaxID=2821107 RepID=UPI001AD9E26C|nr:hypothetical protein [Labrenzia sp. R4_2]MBO9418343.1 hypothetical protein [Labrenzia sp. R4_2]